MTTIVYRDGVMASDSRAYGGDAVPIGTKAHKIQRLPDESLLGISSTRPGLSEALFTYFFEHALYHAQRTTAVHGFIPVHEPGPLEWDGEIDFTALRVMSDGVVLFYNSSLRPAGPLNAEFFAIGSGERYAMGAMKMGASAETAVRVAIDLDVWSALPVQSLQLYP